MDQKFKIGDEVRVDFIGKIKGVKQVEVAWNPTKEILVYEVSNGGTTIAYGVKEEMISELPKPADFDK